MMVRFAGRPYRLRGGIMIALTVLFVAVASTVPPSAEAHWADQAVAEIVLDAQEVRMSLTYPTGIAAFADDDRDGRISTPELQAHRGDLDRFFAEHITMRGTAGGGLGEDPVPGRLRVADWGTGEIPTAPGTSATTHSTILLVYRWVRPLTSAAIRYDLFLPDAPAASCLATIVQGTGVQSVVFTPERREMSFTLGDVSWMSQGAGFLALGIRHILSGYDHLLFLLSLLIVGGPLRSLAKIVSAFTAAHSITLSLAVLGLLALPGRWVESAIALSITYVAVENLWRRTINPRQRWFVTFGFGLVHGLGFASVLRELALPKGTLVTSLVAFNLGVEVGQLAAVGVAAAGLRLLQSWPHEAGLRRWVSAGTAVAGLMWFVQRVLLGG
jgi:hydrogenase/urease accessory protein HupE